MPRWDNTARKGMRAHIFQRSTPELFERWLRRAALITTLRNPGAPLLFVNSWNEWAEGAHLEPDREAQLRYLKAIRRVVSPDTGVDAIPPAVEPRADPLPGDDHRPAISPLAHGLPERAGMDLSVSDGVGWIESVNGAPLQGPFVTATRNATLWLGGWFLGDSRTSGPRREGSSLLLLAEGSAWHAAISARKRRPDLLRGMLATNRRRRRLIRATDRLPPALGRWILYLWVAGRDRIGFEVAVHVGELSPGRYAIAFSDPTATGLCLIRTDFVMVLQRSR
jgi:hypothetical protein